MKIIFLIMLTLSLSINAADFAFSCVSERQDYSISGVILDVYSGGKVNNYEVSDILYKSSLKKRAVRLEGSAYFRHGRSERFIELTGPKGTPILLVIYDNLDNSYNSAHGHLAFSWLTNDKETLICAGSINE